MTTERLDRLGALARAHGSGDVSERESAAGRDRLVAALAGTARASVRAPARRGRGALLASGMTVLAAAAAVLLYVVVSRGRAPMAWHVEGAGEVTQEYVRAPGAESATVAFDDGARVELGGQSRARVTTSREGGARVVLEHGRAAVRPSPRAGSGARLGFLIEAGPYVLAASGASFDVAWTGEVLDVKVASGDVSVQSPQGAVSLRADQHLVARDGDLRVERGTSSTDSRDAPSGAPTSAAIPSVPPSSDPDPAPASTISADGDDVPPPPSLSPSVTKSASWPSRVAAGDYASVVRQAEERGVGKSIDASSLSDLVALADAARYTRRTDLAKRALLAQRSRFAGSGAARTAAFLLGRLAEDREGNAAAAIVWYDRYLTEARSGPFASEALGRKMLAVARVSGADAARPIADEYLRRFPQGSYATVARQKLEGR